MKRINIVIYNCDECPYLASESEWPELYCSHPDKPYRELCTERETLKILGIPKDCPLEDEKE